MSTNHATLIAGVVLAAGRSRRMGTLKQTLPWPRADSSSTVVASAFDAIAPHANHMFVVVGTDAPAVLAALGDRRVTAVTADSDAEMYNSLRAGLRAVVEAETQRPRPFDAALLQPGDHPGVARSTIDALLASFAHDQRGAVMPEHAGKGGHPALIPRTLFEPLLTHHGRGGLRQFWIDHPDWRVRLAVDDPLCVLDLDTPDAYARGLAQHATGCE